MGSNNSLNKTNTNENKVNNLKTDHTIDILFHNVEYEDETIRTKNLKINSTASMVHNDMNY